MKPLDLWKIKKRVLQRRDRSPNCKSDFYCDAIDSVIEKQTSKNIASFIKAENAYIREAGNSTLKRYGASIKEAISNGNYCIDIPFHKVPGKHTYDPPYGYVYLAVSKQRKGEVKVGSTTQDPEKRADLFRRKYGYEDFRIWRKHWVPYPARIEKQLNMRMRGYLVSGLTNGDSKEWYKISRKGAFEHFENEIISANNQS